MASQTTTQPTADPAWQEPPGARRSWLREHRRLVGAVLAAVLVGGFVVFVLPQLTGLGATLRRLRNADPAWTVLAVFLEAASLGGYIALFKTVLSCPEAQIGWRESYEINMAGTVASKLLAAAGAGGVALTVWALRASGLSASAIARRMLAFELLLYTVFTGAILIGGVGLRTGILPGAAPWGLTVIPAVIGGGVIAGVIALRLLPERFGAQLGERDRIETAPGPVRKLSARIIHVIAVAPRTLRQSMSVCAGLFRSRRLGLLGAVAYWGLDIGALWAALHAFGQPPPLTPVVMAYFVGQLGNALPIPGGIGGVEGGMIGSLIAFGTPASLALLGVLGYRLISFWLPTLPGAHAYLRLRRTVGRWQAANAADPFTASAEPAAVPARPRS